MTRGCHLKKSERTSIDIEEVSAETEGMVD